MFIGRRQELHWLNEQYASNQYEMSVIFGRRRVGKTTLIQEFIKDKKAIFFLATQASAQTNLELLSKDIFDTLQPNMPPSTFRSFDDAITYVGEAAKNERIVFVIDEYPYLADAVVGFFSILQRLIDLQLKNTNIFLILSGSSISFMEQKVLSEKSPLYGRKTAQYRIEPFSFRETLEFFSQAKPVDIALYYAITGGVAEYLTFIREDQSVRQNLIRLFFERRGRLLEEPKNYLAQELRNHSLFNDILTAIAQGKTKNNEIATTVQKTPAEINYPLTLLQDLGIVVRETAAGKQGSKKPVYRISDGMFRFWYRFVQPAQSEIAIDNGEAYFDSRVEPFLSDFLDSAFAQIVIEYMEYLHKTKQLPGTLLAYGRWWGPNPITKKEVEIDFLGITDQFTLVGEAKWTNALTSQTELNSLIEKSEFFSNPKHYYLFSKSGFTKQLHKQTDNPFLHLVTFEEIVKQLKS